MEPYRPNEPFIKMKLNGSLLDRMIESGIPLTRALQYFRDNPEGSALETLKLAAEDVVPFYGNYRNNGDWSDYAKEAVMLAAPMPKGGKYSPITGRDGKVRYIADEIIKPDVEKNLEFRDIYNAQIEPFENRNIDVGEMSRRGGPYFDTPDYDRVRILSPYNAYKWDTSIPSEFRNYDPFTGNIDEISYSRSGLKPENINRTLANTAVMNTTYKSYDKVNPISREPIVKGTDEWNKAVAAANAYEEFVRNSINDRTSYVGKATVEPTGIGTEVDVKYGDMTPKQIYDEFIANNQDVLNNTPANIVDNPKLLTYPTTAPHILDALNNSERAKQWFEGIVRNRNTQIEQALENRLIGPGSTNMLTGVTDTRSPVGMRMSDYKNILESVLFRPEEYREGMLRDNINKLINDIDNPMIGPEEKSAILNTIDKYAELYKDAPEAQRNMLTKQFINDIKAAGLEYMDW